MIFYMINEETGKTDIFFKIWIHYIGGGVKRPLSLDIFASDTPYIQMLFSALLFYYHCINIEQSSKGNFLKRKH